MEKGARAQGWLHPQARGVIQKREGWNYTFPGEEEEEKGEEGSGISRWTLGRHPSPLVAISKALPGPCPGSLDVPEGGRRTRPPPQFTQPATAAPGDPGKAAAGREQPVMESRRGSCPPAPTASPPWRNIRFLPLQALGTAPVCLRLGGDHWGCSETPRAGAAHLDGEGSVAARAPPTAGWGSHSAPLGFWGAPGGAAAGDAPSPVGVGWRLLSKQKQIPPCGAG